MYVYRRMSPFDKVDKENPQYFVGFYDPQGKWYLESGPFASTEEAANRVHYLNSLSSVTEKIATEIYNTVYEAVEKYIEKAKNDGLFSPQVTDDGEFLDRWSIRGWDGKKWTEVTLDVAIESAEKYLSAWKQVGDTIRNSIDGNSMELRVFNEIGEHTDACCIIKLD